MHEKSKIFFFIFFDDADTLITPVLYSSNHSISNETTMVDQGPPVDAQCPTWAASLGYMGVAAAVCLSNWGSAVSHSWVSTPGSALGEAFPTGASTPIHAMRGAIYLS